MKRFIFAIALVLGLASIADAAVIRQRTVVRGRGFGFGAGVNRVAFHGANVFANRVVVRQRAFVNVGHVNAFAVRQRAFVPHVAASFSYGYAAPVQAFAVPAFAPTYAAPVCDTCPAPVQAFAVPQFQAFAPAYGVGGCGVGAAFVPSYGFGGYGFNRGFSFGFGRGFGY